MEVKVNQVYTTNNSDIKLIINNIIHQDKKKLIALITVINKKNGIVYECTKFEVLKSTIKWWELIKEASHSSAL